MNIFATKKLMLNQKFISYEKKLFLFVCLIASAIAFFSCGNDEVTCEVNAGNLEQVCYNDHFMSLKNNIKTLNEETFGDEVKTRGIFKFLKKLLSIVISDAVGAIGGTAICPGTGTVVGAVSASAFVATRNVDDIEISSGMHKISINEKSLDGVVVDNPAIKATFADSIGYFHNLIPVSMNNSGKLPLAVQSSKEIVNDVYLEASRISGIPTSIKDADELVSVNNDMRRFVESGIAVFLPDDDFDAYCNKLSGLYPEKANEISVLKEFVYGLSNIDINETDTEYLQKILLLIDESEIDEISKKNLKSAVLVGNASYRLWNVQE